jgi:hypothetical protein
MATAHAVTDFFPRGASAAFRRNQPLALGRMAGQATLVIALLLVNQADVLGNVIFFGVLAAMIATSPERAFKALTIGFLGLVANQAIVPKTPLWTIARFLVPMACLVRFGLDLQALRFSLFRQGYFIALTAFVVVAGCLSLLTGYFVEIAILKLLNFALATSAMIAGAELLRQRKKDLVEWYVTLALVTVVLGFGSIALGIGRNMRGIGTFASTFNGPFYHSNCLGPLAAMMVVYLACVVIFGKYRNRWICLFLAACLVYFMALTQSRTSFVALFVGLLTTIGLTFVIARRGYIRLRMNVSRFALVGGLAMAAVGGVLLDMSTGNSVTKAVVAFANKGGRTEEFDVDQALSSRKAIVELSWQNFLHSPLIGIGFEVSTSEFFRQNATLFYAPIEKGFLPVAVLEETGVIGTFFFVVFLLGYLRHLARRLNIPGIALFLTFLAVNCGEAMFFAVGGHGAVGWLWFLGGMMLGDVCVEQIKRPAARSVTL